MEETITKEYKFASLIKRVLLRFIRTFVAGGITTMLAVAPLAGFEWGEIRTWLLALVFAFISGGLMAFDKLVRK